MSGGECSEAYELSLHRYPQEEGGACSSGHPATKYHCSRRHTVGPSDRYHQQVCTHCPIHRVSSGLSNVDRIVTALDGGILPCHVMILDNKIVPFLVMVLDSGIDPCLVMVLDSGIDPCLAMILDGEILPCFFMVLDSGIVSCLVSYWTAGVVPCIVFVQTPRYYRVL